MRPEFLRLPAPSRCATRRFESSPLFAEVGDERGADHLKAVEARLRQQLGGGAGALTLRSVLDALARNSHLGTIVAAGW